MEGGEIYRCATGASLEEAFADLDGIRYGELKDRVADTLVEVLTPDPSPHRPAGTPLPTIFDCTDSSASTPG